MPLQVQDVKRCNLKNITFDKLLDETASLSIPVIFTGINELNEVAKKWGGGYVGELAARVGEAAAPVHSAAYWASNPIQKMFQSRRQHVDFNAFVNGNIYPKGSYYICHHVMKHGNLVSARLTAQNNFDEAISRDIPIFDFSAKADFLLTWLSQGQTKSNLHADPLHNFYCQIVGSKRIFLIAEKQNLLHLRERLAPHLLKVRDPYLDDAIKNKYFSRLKCYDFYLNPGEALFIPVWMFHHIEASNPGLNISIGYMLPPDIVDKVTSLSYWLARYSRAWFPRLVSSKRKKFEIDLLKNNGVPFFRPGTQLVRQASKNPDLVKDASFYIFNRKILPIPIIEPDDITMISRIDGMACMDEIASSTGLSLPEIEACLIPYIESRLIGMYPFNDSSNDFNWRHQLNEVV